MNSTLTISNLAAALVKAQAKIGGAVKDASNPFFKSKYATLGDVIFACKGALIEEGITVSQLVTTGENGGPALETILLHSSGEWMGATMPIACAKANDPQAMGSAISYAKRYALQSLLLMPSVDDDGEAAMFRASTPETLREEVPTVPVNALKMDYRKVRCSWGKNRGLMISELNPQQCEWYLANLYKREQDPPTDPGQLQVDAMFADALKQWQAARKS